jgi:hypothetical protein
MLSCCLTIYEHVITFTRGLRLHAFVQFVCCHAPQLLFWDCRAGSAPVQSVSAAHGAGQDVQCVDWSALAEHYVATGGVGPAACLCNSLLHARAIVLCTSPCEPGVIHPSMHACHWFG